MCCNLSFSLTSKGNYGHHTVLAIAGLIRATSEQTVIYKVAQPLLPSFRCQSENGGSAENLERRMPREVIWKAVYPNTLLGLLHWSWDSWGLPPCSSTCSFFGRRAWKGEEEDWWQQGSGPEKGNSELLHEKKNAPVLWEPKRLAWLGTQAALSFSSGFLIHLAAIKHVEPQHFRFPRQGPVLGFCLQCSQVLLCEILEKMTLKTIFAPVGCEKLQQRLQIQLLNKIIVSQKHPPVGILP